MPIHAPTYDEIQEAVREYCRGYIREQRARKRSYQYIADRLGVSHVWVMALEKDAAKGVGGKVEYQVAMVLHGGSVDELRRAALNAAAGGVVIVEDSGEPVEITRGETPKTNGKKAPKSRRV